MSKKVKEKAKRNYQKAVALFALAVSNNNS